MQKITFNDDGDFFEFVKSMAACGVCYKAEKIGGCWQVIVTGC